MFVLDIGANKGYFSHDILVHSREARVLAVEPNSNLFKQSLKEIAEVFPDRFSSDFRALGDSSHRGVLHHVNSRNGQLASLLKLNPNSSGWKREHLEFLDTDSSIGIEVITPMDLVKEYGLSDIHFLKIDIQGTDVDVLDSFLECCRIRSGVIEVDCGFKSGEERYRHSEGNDVNRLFEILHSKGHKIVKILPNNESSDELNIFFGESVADASEIMTKLGLAGNPAFARFWKIQGLGKSSQDSARKLSRSFILKIFQGLLHPIQSLESMLVKLSR